MRRSSGFHQNKTEGSIKLNIPNLSNLRAKVNTSFHHIANLPWRLAAKTECTKRTSHVKFFSVYIDCNPESESTLWSCDAVVEFRLLSQRPDVPHFSRQVSFHEMYASPARTFTFALHLLVPHAARMCYYIARLFQYLSLYSPVFYALFFGKFSERDKREIPVEDVILDEFIELLNVVYPSHKPISTDNVEFLLELGDKFEIQFVIDECERYLISTEDIPIVTKLVWADQYCLAKLQDACVRTFKCVNDIKALKLTEEYKNLSDTTKAALLEKIFKILKD
ncbi:unnamed protein product [Haemonchus placei]|uniref:BTB domain-containing protein n=1 Tax=Haemonchus placei TaxID=6290 RepID=A0A0N4WYE5_HAEPC|nr:unnamed protein product [Haemonchus placei]